MPNVTPRAHAPHIPMLSDMTLADIPPRLGLFSLRGGLLLPRGQLPLRIFEQRYISLVEDVLGTGRMIGLIQPAPQGHRGIGTPPLEKTGTVGRITSFLEREDGTFSLTLTGICRFHLLRDQLTERGWREGMIDASSFGLDLLETDTPPLDREHLNEALQNYFEYHHLKTNWHNLETMNDEALLTALPMVLPLDSAAKQALLEARDLNDRAILLIDILNRDSPE